MSTHSEMKRFKCSLCDVKFKARENLRKHMKLYHKSEKETDSKATEQKESGQGTSKKLDNCDTTS